MQGLNKVKFNETSGIYHCAMLQFYLIFDP